MITKLSSDTWIGAGLVLLSIVLLTQVFGDLHTFLVPFISTASIGVMGVFIALTPLIRKKLYKVKEEQNKPNSQEKELERKRPWGLRGILSVTLIIIFAFMISKMGFVISTFLVLIGLLCINGERWWKATMISAIVNFAFMILFTHVIYLPLPLGEAPFRSISLFIQYLIF